uniref:Uncharacterized protein n=1 Tax=Brugia timori TaxID=42155 RepID=A0A0R3QCQ2_9BILA
MIMFVLRYFENFLLIFLQMLASFFLNIVQNI